MLTQGRRSCCVPAEAVASWCPNPPLPMSWSLPADNRSFKKVYTVASQALYLASYLGCMKRPGINCLSMVFWEWSHMCKQPIPGRFSPPTWPWYNTNLCPYFTFSIRLSPVTMATESSTPSSAATLLRAATQLWGFTPPALATTLIPAKCHRVSRTGCWPLKLLAHHFAWFLSREVLGFVQNLECTQGPEWK